MIWRILFVSLCTLFLFLLYGGLTATLPVTELNFFLGYVFMIIYVFILAYFYSLGWKKKIFSLKVSNCIFSGIVLYYIYSIVAAVVSNMPTLVFEYKKTVVEETNESSIIMSAVLVLALVSIIFYSILYSPILVAFIKYRKCYNDLKEINKPYWKLYSITMIVNSIFAVIYCLVNMDYSKAIFMDYATLFLVLYSILFLVCFAFNFKCGKQLFWKISSIFFVVFSIFACFACSEMFLSVSKMNYLFSSYSVLIVSSIATVFEFYALYKYAFTDDVYKKGIEDVKY